MAELSTATTLFSPRGTSVIAGKYAIEALLAEGGMGLVYRGRHVELDQPVAIKIVRPELSLDEEAVGRFLNEARAIAKLRSPYVARVLDSGRIENGSPYMVLEFLEGRDLRKLLDAGSGPSADWAMELVLHVCEALAEAHAAGIVHRDIKPDNLFIARLPGDASIVKVLDFGICKRLRGATTRSYTARGRALGSPMYMAPEQITAPEHIDVRVDVWSLGVVLFELLTGRPPFTGKNVSVICKRVVHGEPEPLRRHRPDLPGAIEDVIGRCLEKDPARRFASVAELAAALAPFVENGREAATRAQLIATGIDAGGDAAARSSLLHGSLPALPHGRRRSFRRAGALAALVVAAFGVFAVGAGVTGQASVEASVPYVHEELLIPAPLPAFDPERSAERSTRGEPALAPPGVAQHAIGTAGPRVVPAERGSPRARARRERGAPSSVSRRESARARANDAARAPARPASAPQPATRALPDVHELMVPYEDLRGP